MSDQSIFTSFPAITGGIPIGADVVPSIIFTVAYGCLIPAALFRTIQYRRPFRLCFLAIRLDIFIVARIVTFIIRTLEGEHVKHNGGNPTPALGLFIAEQVLLGIGFIVLVNNIVDYLKFQLTRTDYGAPIIDPYQSQQQPRSRLNLAMIHRLMHIALLVSIALGIVAGTEYSSAIDNPGGSGAHQVRSYRLISTAICLAVAGLVALISIFILFVHTHLPRRSSIYLAIVALIMLIIPAYRLSVTLETTHSLAELISTRTRVLFYILQAFFEWFATVLLLIPDMRTFFGVPGTLITPVKTEYDNQFAAQNYAPGPGAAGQEGYSYPPNGNGNGAYAPRV